MNAPRSRRSLAVACCAVAIAAASAGVIAAGCGNGSLKPCNDCPDMSGTWNFSFETAGDPPAECQDAGHTSLPPSIAISQVGSGLTSSSEGVALQGTLFDTFDFTLNGTTPDPDGGASSVAVTGRFVPALAATDAGERLQGTFTATWGTGAGSCTLSRGYTAAH